MLYPGESTLSEREEESVAYSLNGLEFILIASSDRLWLLWLLSYSSRTIWVPCSYTAASTFNPVNKFFMEGWSVERTTV